MSRVTQGTIWKIPVAKPETVVLRVSAKSVIRSDIMIRPTKAMTLTDTAELIEISRTRVLEVR